MPKIPGINHLEAVRALRKQVSESSVKANMLSCLTAFESLQFPGTIP